MTRLSKLLWPLLLAACARAPSPAPPPAAAPPGRPAEAAPGRAWWKEVVVYQVYPRSFQDSDGDGVGDLRGIISRLDYIENLGVDVVWLNPVYRSPNDDNGYDISDYRSIMDEMGTMADFDAMLRGMHRRGIKLIMDLVVNHTSDAHPWFQQSRRSRDNPYRAYYHWWPAERGVPAHRWSFFDEEGSAWRYDSTTRAYYLHYFSRTQPDLNWENPRVRREVYDIMKFWFDKGVDGFRMDVIPFISKDTTFPPLPASYAGDYVAYYAKGPRLHQYLREMNREVLRKYDVMTVGEGGGVKVEDALDFVAEDRHELQTFFHFELVDRWGRRPGNFMYPDSGTRSLSVLKTIFTKWDSVFATSGRGTVFLGNHDQSRMVSRYGNDAPPYRRASAKMLHTLLLTMRGTPYVYNGDEIGMTNIRFTDIRDYRDLMTINYYRRLQKEGGDRREFLSGQAEISRDNGRTPMQWSADSNAGFTRGTPWIRINPDYRSFNVAAAERDTGSVLHYFRRLVRLRNTEPALIYGRYRLLDRQNPEVFAYTRSLGGRTLMVALSFSQGGGRTSVPEGYYPKRALANNLPRSPVRGTELVLGPYQAVVLELARGGD
ncbi:MAG: glycoside hydrolase family 13 protein [Gemmatimonadales bacterium]